ncbi:hypothetical protein SNE40_006103 [Patella caerulea]|uniref:TTF-type domain-containing protein n=1 Tax=Patella caerulea TaxID=87958 RepID=A0AAN8K0T0_PATCE
MSGEDRHGSRGARHFLSGYEKRKRAKEKEEREKVVVAKTRKISDFFAQRGETDDGKEKEVEIESNVTVPTEKDASVSGPSALSCESVIRSPQSNDPDTDTSENSDGKGDDGQTTGTSENSDGNEDDGQTEREVEGDIGNWPSVISEAMINHWVSSDRSELQCCDGPFDHSLRPGTEGDRKERSCSKSIFSRKLQNGEIVKRTWLSYSRATGKVYCLVCKLFGGIGALSADGFDDWKHAIRKLDEHERSPKHCTNIVAFSARSITAGRIDEELAKQADEIKLYWREVIKRCVSVIKFLSERGLSFRGSDENIGSPKNGNYLGLLEVLSQYDSFLAQHIQKHANKGTGHTSYLSSTICEELIALLGQKVTEDIVSRLQRAKYYSFTVDSTPDVSHSDQLTVVVRYIESGGKTVERFLTFLENTGHTGRQQATALLEYFTSVGIDISNCRGQSYDNAANMSGRYQGMQALIKTENPLAVFVPCFAHSLNLVGQSACGSCRLATAFFGFVEQIYVFFTASTARYKVLKAALTGENIPVPKHLSDTRWSAHHDATKALHLGYNKIMEALDEISNDAQQKGDTRHMADQLYQTMCKLETGFYVGFWATVLERFHRTSVSLQSQSTDLNTAVELLKSLRVFVESLRDRFDDFLTDGIERSGTNDFDAPRSRKRNVRLDPLDYGRAEEASLSPEDAFRVNGFVCVIDVLRSELDKRTNAYSELNDRFGFLRLLNDMTPEDIRKSASMVVKIYQNDLSPELSEEMVHFQALMKQTEKELTEASMYEMIVDRNISDTFPNVAVLLRIYLSLMVTNCSGERSFSKLKLIKNNLRSVMGQSRLVSLTILATESDVLRALDTDQLITDFAGKKARKKVI